MAFGFGFGMPRSFATPFSPASLFSTGAKGTWYDPSDMTTLFQDSAGTTPVTAVEQPVGLMLDKSQGLVLGSELVTNGDFNAGSTGYVEVLNGTVSYATGAMVATGITASTGVYQDVPVVSGTPYKVSWVIGTSTNWRISIYNGAGFGTSLYNNGTGSSTSGVFTAVVFPTTTVIRIYAHTGTGTIATFDDISVKELAGNHAFQSTAASRPVLKVDGNGKYYLKFDGVDDSLRTNSINFTSTDKMSVFAGVRKLSDTSDQIIFELSANLNSNNGSFYLSGSISGAAVHAFAGKGSLPLFGSVASASGLASPITSVLTGTSDIAGDSVILRRNGAQVASSTADQGTGNFGNYPLYIGRRGGTALPFNGQLYSMIIVGKAVTTGELTSTETYTASKTGVALA